MTKEDLKVDVRERESWDYIMSMTVPTPSLNMKAGIVCLSCTSPDLNNRNTTRLDSSSTCRYFIFKISKKQDG